MYDKPLIGAGNRVDLAGARDINVEGRKNNRVNKDGIKEDQRRDKRFVKEKHYIRNADDE